MSRFKALSRGKEPQVLERWMEVRVPLLIVDNPNALEGWDGVLDINSDPVEAVSLKALLRENKVTLQGHSVRGRSGLQRSSPVQFCATGPKSESLAMAEGVQEETCPSWFVPRCLLDPVFP